MILSHDFAPLKVSGVYPVDLTLILILSLFLYSFSLPLNFHICFRALYRDPDIHTLLHETHAEKVNNSSSIFLSWIFLYFMKRRKNIVILVFWILWILVPTRPSCFWLPGNSSKFCYRSNNQSWARTNFFSITTSTEKGCQVE